MKLQGKFCHDFHIFKNHIRTFTIKITIKIHRFSLDHPQKSNPQSGPYRKYESQMGLLFPIWKNHPNVPNHQPETIDNGHIYIGHFFGHISSECHVIDRLTGA